MLYSNKDHKLHHNNILIDGRRNENMDTDGWLNSVFFFKKDVERYAYAGEVSKYDKRKILKVSLYNLFRRMT